MQDLAQLQNQCERVKTNVRKLAGQIGTRLVCSDLDQLLLKMPDRLKKTDSKKYVLDEKVFISVEDKDNDVFVQDRRGTLSYAWSFEIRLSDVEGVLITGDAFTVERKVYSVSTIDDNVFLKVSVEAEETFNRLRHTEEKLMSGDEAEFSYDLVSDYKEDRHECADLETMFEVVLARNYK